MASLLWWSRNFIFCHFAFSIFDAMYDCVMSDAGPKPGETRSWAGQPQYQYWSLTTAGQVPQPSIANTDIHDTNTRAQCKWRTYNFTRWHASTASHWTDNIIINTGCCWNHSRNCLFSSLLALAKSKRTTCWWSHVWKLQRQKIIPLQIFLESDKQTNEGFLVVPWRQVLRKKNYHIQQSCKLEWQSDIFPGWFSGQRGRTKKIFLHLHSYTFETN